MNRFFAVAALASLFSVVCLGCGESGPALGHVTGKVTLDGKPLPNVSVTFFIEKGQGGSASAITDASGNYELNSQDGRKGATVGKNKASVTTVQQTKSAVDMSKIPSDSPEYAKMAAGGGDDYNVKFTEPIPAKYNLQTELEFDVKSGSQVINLELKSS